MTLLQLGPCALAALPILLSGCGSSDNPSFPGFDFPKVTSSGRSGYIRDGKTEFTATFNRWEIKAGSTSKYRTESVPVLNGGCSISISSPNGSLFLTQYTGERCDQLLCVPPGSPPAAGTSCSIDNIPQPTFDGKKPCSDLCPSSKDSCDVWTASTSHNGTGEMKQHVLAISSVPIRALPKTGDDSNYTQQFQYYFKAGSNTRIGERFKTQFSQELPIQQVYCYSKWDTTSDIPDSKWDVPKDWSCPHPDWPPKSFKVKSMMNETHGITV